jgi:hypothetical protein
MKETFIPNATCLACNARIDAATSFYGDHAPESGDVTICFYCGHIMIFREGMRLDNLNKEEAYKIAGDRQILRVQHMRGEIIKKRKS